jgi:3D (Asp-Asp-Asp) domain-containing protein
MSLTKLVGFSTAILVCGLTIQSFDIYQKEQEIATLEAQVEEMEKELVSRDTTLAHYRNRLDQNDLDILAKDERIEELELEIEGHQKECPLNGTPIILTLTYYGDGAEENGGYAGITAWGEKLSGGMVASNVYPRGTEFVLETGEVYTVADRGGSNFNNSNRLDVFVPRLKGETDAEYNKRISDYGVRKVKAYIQD